MNFEFATAARIIFGAGTARSITAQVKALGQRALLVTGSKPDRARWLVDLLHEAHIADTILSVSSEPTVGLVDTGVSIAKQNECDLIIGIGGGSVIDAAKAIAAILTNDGDILDYLEVIGKGRTMRNPPLPCVAIPTTAGTGAEATRNAVLASSEHKIKVSLRSPMMLPDLAVVDSELTRSLPPAETASTGLDALTQLLEPFVSINANPVTDAVSREGMQRAARSLYRAYENGDDGAAREDMALASLLGGMALANARLGAVHGFAGPIGGLFAIPHGVVCARLLPMVMSANISALRRSDTRECLTRYTEAARILTGRPDAAAEDGLDWVNELCVKLQIPPLADFGITADHFPEIVEKAQKASSMKGNPVVLTDAELTDILQQAI